MNEVIIPEDDDSEPDDLLVEFAHRGNRAAIIEEVYRRANNHPSGYALAQDAGVDAEDIEAIADAAWNAYRDLDDGMELGERMLLLEMSYGHVADHLFATIEDATDPTA